MCKVREEQTFKINFNNINSILEKFQFFKFELKNDKIIATSDSYLKDFILEIILTLDFDVIIIEINILNIENENTPP